MEIEHIKSKSDLHDFLDYEIPQYRHLGKKERFLDTVTHNPNYLIEKYVILLRKTEYYYNNRKNPYYALMYLIYRRRKNNFGMKIGVEIFENTFDKGLMIYHAGSIVINKEAQIGKNCKLHGSNCIGNSGKDKKCPVLGDNIRLGVGSSVIGDVYLADNITVAAGAVVIHSFREQGVTIGGIPAKVVKGGNCNG